MSIEAGVQFLFAKAPINKGFSIFFNDNRLYGDSEMVTVESFPFYPSIPFNERSVGCAFWAKGCASFNYYFWHIYIKRRSSRSEAALFYLVQISIDPRVHLLVDLEVGHSTAAINPVKTRMERDKEAEAIRCFNAKVSAVIGKCGMCLHLRLFIRIWRRSLHATPVFSPASLFPEDLTPCCLFSLIMASHLMGWPQCGFRVVHRVEKRVAENTAKPRRNCSGEALPLTT